MADQGKWFKLWVGARRDSELSNLSKEDFANWCLLGMYLKEQGCEGMTTLAKPAVALQRHMELNSYEELINVLRKFPNCVIEEKQNSSVTTVTILTVTWKNWAKYQGDYSNERVRKFRALVTAKKRREEKRGEREEKRVITGFQKPTSDQVNTYAQSIGFDLNGKDFCDYYAARGWEYKRGQPMKDWQAAVRTWKKNQNKEAAPTTAAVVI